MTLGKTSKLVIGTLLLGMVIALGTVGVKKRIRNLIQAEIVHFNNTRPYTFAFDNLELSLLKSSAEFQNLSLIPDSVSTSGEVRDSFEHPHIFVQSLQMKGLNAFAIVLRKHLVIESMGVNGIEVLYQKKSATDHRFRVQNENKSERTILLSKLKEIKLGRFFVSDFSFTLTQADRDTLASYTLKEFEIDGIRLQKRPNIPSLFSINTDDLSLRLSNQRLGLAQKEYDLELGDVQFNAKKGLLKMKNVSYGPMLPKEKLGSKYRYNTTITESLLPNVTVYGLAIEKLFFNQGVHLDSLILESPKFVIYKDNSRPWNKSKRPKLPSELLRDIGDRFYFKTMVFREASLDYTEKTENHGKPLNVPMRNLYLNINRAEQKQGSSSLNISMDCEVFGNLPLELVLAFPDFESSDDFYFSGSTGSTTFQSFNPVLLPTSGIKFEKGNLKGMTFKGKANSLHAEGSLTMLYDDLQAAVFKKNQTEKNKTVSFFANQAVRSSNPSRSGRTMAGAIDFNRVEYKGFGNFLFKSIESGIINSVYPLGKRKREK
ncbi:hypothetical protein [Ulvibacterium sp.]|uniref:hypothetical protein n=1 Tax=Ulvibacterium sp. TaxID=2665914 RepID=UPI003BAD80DE